MTKEEFDLKRVEFIASVKKEFERIFPDKDASWVMFVTQAEQDSDVQEYGHGCPRCWYDFLAEYVSKHFIEGTLPEHNDKVEPSNENIPFNLLN